jgi:hypothetical protein
MENESIFFDVKNFPNESMEYVLWIDIMGIQNSMSVSLRTSANFIGKMHMALLEYKKKNISIYPVMDGAYVTAKKAEDMKKFIDSVMNRFANEIIAEEDDIHKFLVRGGLAYGPVIHGKDIPKESGKYIEQNQDYMNGLLLGMPMIRACLAEKNAPPLGIHCDETARIPDRTFSFRWYHWWGTDSELIPNLKKSLHDYFDYYEKRYLKHNYTIDRLKEHREMCDHYFADFEDAEEAK